VSAYTRGARLERVARKTLERDGYIVTRSAGSKGPVDLVAWNRQGFRLIQVKKAGAARPITRQQLVALPRPRNASVELWERAGRQWHISHL
jgi:Holliday junction resolvase